MSELKEEPGASTGFHSGSFYQVQVLLLSKREMELSLAYRLGFHGDRNEGP